MSKASLKRFGLSVMMIPAESADLVAARTQGFLEYEMRCHPGEVDKAIRAAMRDCYTQGLLDGAQVQKGIESHRAPPNPTQETTT